jgi:hypothetical protein
LVALLEGQIPKNIPTAPETTMPEMAAQAGTWAGSDLATFGEGFLNAAHIALKNRIAFLLSNNG